MEYLNNTNLPLGCRSMNFEEISNKFVWLEDLNLYPVLRLEEPVRLVEEKSGKKKKRI